MILKTVAHFTMALPYTSQILMIENILYPSKLYIGTNSHQSHEPVDYCK